MKKYIEWKEGDSLWEYKHDGGWKIKRIPKIPSIAHFAG